MDFNTSWVIYATWEPSFVDEVRGHISKVIWGQVVRLVENVKVASFENLKSDGNQTWFIDTWEPSYVHVVKVIYQGQRSSEVKV